METRLARARRGCKITSEIESVRPPKGEVRSIPSRAMTCTSSEISNPVSGGGMGVTGVSSGPGKPSQTCPAEMGVGVLVAAGCGVALCVAVGEAAGAGVSVSASGRRLQAARSAKTAASRSAPEIHRRFCMGKRIITPPEAAGSRRGAAADLLIQSSHFTQIEWQGWHPHDPIPQAHPGNLHSPRWHGGGD